jgi:translin
MLKEIIRKTSDILTEEEQIKDEAYNLARKSRTLSKKTIICLHNQQLNLVTENLKQTEKILRNIKKIVSCHPKLNDNEILNSAEQEYTEATILFKILKNEEYPTPETLGVSYENYVLGLADVPGELRRQTLEKLKLEDIESAEKNLNKMEEIFLNLMSITNSHLLKGLRRKIDIIRGVNERTRAEIITEINRNRLLFELRKINSSL